MCGTRAEASVDLPVDLVLVVLRESVQIKGVWYCWWMSQGGDTIMCAERRLQEGSNCGCHPSRALAPSLQTCCATKATATARCTSWRVQPTNATHDNTPLWVG